MCFMLPNFRIMQKKDCSCRMYQNLKITHADPDHQFLAITQNWAMRLFVGFVMQGHISSFIALRWVIFRLISLQNFLFLKRILRSNIKKTPHNHTRSAYPTHHPRTPFLPILHLLHLPSARLSINSCDVIMPPKRKPADDEAAAGPGNISALREEIANQAFDP